MRTPIAVGLLSLAVGCGTEHEEPVDPVEPLARLDLRAAMNSADVHPVGFTLAADGTRFILDENAGLLRVDGDHLVEVVSMSEMPDPGPTAPLVLPFTDLVAYSPHVFALTAIGDGYFLDTEAMTLTQHFCYLPGGEGGGGAPVAVTQRTDAMAYDAVFGKLWAQPVTRDVAGTFIRSELAKYNVVNGDDEAWLPVSDDTAATAMMVHGSNVKLGQGSKVSERVLNVTALQEIDDLERFGVKSIDGMAIDTSTNRLIVVDQISDAMFDIDLAQTLIEP